MAEGSRYVESIDSTDWQPSTLPALRIDEAGGSDQFSIRFLTHKRFTFLTSRLYEVLEEKGLDVLHSPKSSTKDKVLHSIQVKVTWQLKKLKRVAFHELSKTIRGFEIERGDNFSLNRFLGFMGTLRSLKVIAIDLGRAFDRREGIAIPLLNLFSRLPNLKLLHLCAHLNPGFEQPKINNLCGPKKSLLTRN